MQFISESTAWPLKWLRIFSTAHELFGEYTQSYSLVTKDMAVWPVWERTTLWWCGTFREDILVLLTTGPVSSAPAKEMCSPWRREKWEGKNIPFNQFPLFISYSKLNKIHAFLKKGKDWWILWTDFKVNDKQADYDTPSYPKQKQVRKKAYRVDRKPIKHKEKKKKDKKEKKTQNVDNEYFN